ncbi:hypothetical protein GEMRC1_003190 [Eukaryota sp. GEM-RC1]
MSDLDTLEQISKLLQCPIDRPTLEILVKLCEDNVNPESLAAVVKDLQKQAARRKSTSSSSPKSPSEL